MFNVYWGDRFIAAYPDEKEVDFQLLCISRGIEYQLGEDGSYFLFPPLKRITVAICTMYDGQEDRDQVITSLAEGLKKQGALVLFVSSRSPFNRLMSVVQVQILLSFTKKNEKHKRRKVRFFYSLWKRAESNKVISAIIKNMTMGYSALQFELAGFLNFICALKYFRFYRSSVPTVLMELHNVDHSLHQSLERAILQAITELYGAAAGENQYLQAVELCQALQKIIEAGPKKEITAAVQNIKQSVQNPRQSNKAEKVRKHIRVNQQGNLYPPDAPCFPFSVPYPMESSNCNDVPIQPWQKAAEINPPRDIPSRNSSASSLTQEFHKLPISLENAES